MEIFLILEFRKYMLVPCVVQYHHEREREAHHDNDCKSILSQQWYIVFAFIATDRAAELNFRLATNHTARQS
jgi:hypothetical protein